MNLEDKIDIVKNDLKDKKVAIGFSGGSDSALLAYLSSKVAKETLAITIDSPLMPTNFIKHTKDMCTFFGINHEIIDMDFYSNEDFISNTKSRCHTCRNLMYCEIKKLAMKKGFDFICDGNNISDLVDDRPGILITYAQEFKTPLIDAKLTSKEIREYLNQNKIPYSESTTCLATRIPTDTKITKEKIDRIRHCEDYILSNTDCKIVKVRDLEYLSICEVDNICNILSENKFIQINDELKKQGWQKVALNLSQITDNDEITLEYSKDSFSYKLPFTVNITNTKKQLKDEILFENENQIKIRNMEIHANGLIRGKDIKSYENTLDDFMELLPKIRRNI